MASEADSSTSQDVSDNDVQQTRAWTGLWVVVGGDVVIGAAAILGVIKTAGAAGGAATPMVSILASAFAAIGTMTTAYFGIKTMSNTAQSFAAVHKALANALVSGLGAAQAQHSTPGPASPSASSATTGSGDTPGSSTSGSTGTPDSSS